MHWAQVINTRKETLVGTIILTAAYLVIIAQTIARNCEQLTCEPLTTGWQQYSIFPHCCVELTGWQLLTEYILLVFVPLILSYVLVAIAVWTYKRWVSERQQ